MRGTKAKRELMEKRIPIIKAKMEEGLTHTEIARHIGASPSYITRAMKMSASQENTQADTGQQNKQIN